MRFPKLSVEFPTIFLSQGKVAMIWNTHKYVDIIQYSILYLPLQIHSRGSGFWAYCPCEWCWPRCCWRQRRCRAHVIDLTFPQLTYSSKSLGLIHCPSSQIWESCHFLMWLQNAYPIQMSADSCQIVRPNEFKQSEILKLLFQIHLFFQNDYDSSSF